MENRREGSVRVDLDASRRWVTLSGVPVAIAAGASTDPPWQGEPLKERPNPVSQQQSDFARGPAAAPQAGQAGRRRLGERSAGHGRCDRFPLPEPDPVRVTEPVQVYWGTHVGCNAPGMENPVRADVKSVLA